MSDPKEDALTLAVLCDLILGEDAADRSNNALVIAAGKLVNLIALGHVTRFSKEGKVDTR